MGGKSLRSLALQYVSPAQLNDSISLFEVRTHCKAWFAVHNDTIYVLELCLFEDVCNTWAIKIWKSWNICFKRALLQ